MKKRKVLKDDGRYLIYYSFCDDLCDAAVRGAGADAVGGGAPNAGAALCKGSTDPDPRSESSSFPSAPSASSPGNGGR